MGELTFRNRIYRYNLRGFIIDSRIRLPRQRATRWDKKVGRKKRIIIKREMQRKEKEKHFFFPELLIENRGGASDWFMKTRKMNKLEKYEDLLETSQDTRKPTKENIERWKKNPKHRDIEGVDTYNLGFASTLNPPTKDELVESYIKSDGDIFSFKTKDKGLRESIHDEMYDEIF